MRRFSIWNFYARVYDVINENLPYLKMLDEVVKKMDIKGNIKILDAGCGTGNLIKRMSELTSDSKFLGVDSSKEMLERARKKFLSSPRVTLQYADLNERLKFSDNSFDCVVSINTLYALQNPKQIISEFYRILKPQGKLVFTNPHDRAKFSGIIKRQFQDLGLLKFIVKLIINLPSLLVIIVVNTFFLKKDKNYWSKEEAVHILKESGFNNINIKLTYANQALMVSANKI